MRGTPLFAIAVVTLCALVLAGPAAAQEDQPLEASALVAFGGSIDESQSGLGNSGYQLGLSLGVGRRTKVGVRYGEIDFGSGGQIASVFRPTFQYITVGGEYTFSEGYYESGIYLALGSYQLDGVQGGQAFSESTLGVALGATGEFEITRRLGLVLEVAGHFADFGPARYFATFHGGVAYHF